MDLEEDAGSVFVKKNWTLEVILFFPFSFFAKVGKV